MAPLAYNETLMLFVLSANSFITSSLSSKDWGGITCSHGESLLDGGGPCGGYGCICDNIDSGGPCEGGGA